MKKIALAVSGIAAVGTLSLNAAPTQAAETEGVMCTIETPQGYSCSGTISFRQDYINRPAWYCKNPNFQQMTSYSLSSNSSELKVSDLRKENPNQYHGGGFSASVINNSHTQANTATIFYECGAASVEFKKRIDVAGPLPGMTDVAKIGCNGSKNHYVKEINFDVSDIRGGAVDSGITLTTGFRLDRVRKNVTPNEIGLEFTNTASKPRDSMLANSISVGVEITCGVGWPATKLPSEIRIKQRMWLPKATLLGSGTGSSMLHCPTTQPYMTYGHYEVSPKVKASSIKRTENPDAYLYTFKNPRKEAKEDADMFATCSSIPEVPTPPSNPTE